MLIATAVGLLEMAGFACRIRMFTKAEYGVFVAMQCLLIIPPSFLALMQYITLGKVVSAIQTAKPEVRLPLKGRLIMIIYFIIEIGSLALQGAGAGISVSPDSAPKNTGAGRALLIIGLAFLVALMISYLVTTIYVNFSPAFEVRKSRNLVYLFCALYASTTLLLIRNIFRLIEFADGWYGSLAIQEKYFYALDSLMVLLLLAVSTFFHFGIFFNGYRREQEAAAIKASAPDSWKYNQAGEIQMA